MTRLQQTMQSRKAPFVAYLTAGDPDLEATSDFVWRLSEAGVDVIELGVPFSDPVADGPTNQLAAMRGLESGTTLSKILHQVERLRKQGFTTPIVLFTYFNPVFFMGVDLFAREAKHSGVDGVLVVDLPPEEASDYLSALSAESLDSVFLAAPTTPTARLKAIGQASSGFVYCVSRTGVTGTDTAPAENLSGQVARLRQACQKPIAVGFGISTPEQAGAVASLGVGVVVGSHFVKTIAVEGASAGETLYREATALVTATRKAADGI